MLEVGSSVRYKGVGSGRVISHVTREFRGEERVFAVIEFPHRDMQAQLPIGDEKIVAKLEKTLSERAIRKLLKSLVQLGKPLPRTWDQREEAGTEILRDGGPQEWAELLASYAHAASAGVPIVASDADIVEAAQELLSAELALGAGFEYPEAVLFVQQAFDSAAVPVKGRKAANFDAAGALA